MKLGTYRLRTKIASGGMATVYRGELDVPGVNHPYAIKVFHPHLSDLEGFRQRFLDEARVAARVDHANVVKTFDVGADRGYDFLILELIDGVTLRELQIPSQSTFQADETASQAALEPLEAAQAVADAARGLHAVHDITDEEGQLLNVVHRDLSPHNLMLDVTGRTVLIDLGLSKSRDQIGHTQTGVLCGKLPYMSPEQSQLAHLDRRSDIFSLGSVLFELCCGHAPFGESHSAQTLEQLRSPSAQQLGQNLKKHDVPASLQEIIVKCLAQNPDERFQTAQRLADELERVIQSEGSSQHELRASLAQKTVTTQVALQSRESKQCLPPLLQPCSHSLSHSRSLAQLPAASGLNTSPSLRAATPSVSEGSSHSTAPAFGNDGSDGLGRSYRQRPPLLLGVVGLAAAAAIAFLLQPEMLSGDSQRATTTRSSASMSAEANNAVLQANQVTPRTASSNMQPRVKQPETEPVLEEQADTTAPAEEEASEQKRRRRAKRKRRQRRRTLKANPYQN